MDFRTSGTGRAYMITTNGFVVSNLLYVKASQGSSSYLYGLRNSIYPAYYIDNNTGYITYALSGYCYYQPSYSIYQTTEIAIQGYQIICPSYFTFERVDYYNYSSAPNISNIANLTSNITGNEYNIDYGKEVLFPAILFIMVVFLMLINNSTIAYLGMGGASLLMIWGGFIPLTLGLVFVLLSIGLIFASMIIKRSR